MIHRLRYNLLALAQAAIGAANLFLLYSVYGTGDSTAVFLIALSVIGSLQLLLLMASDQFVFHYIKMKVDEPERAETIFIGMWAITATLGFACAAAMFVFADYAIGVFAHGFTGERRKAAVDLLRILSLSLLFGSVLQLTQARLSALGRIGWSYALTILPQLLQTCVLLYASLHPIAVHWPASSQPVGQALATLLGLLVARPAFKRSLHSAATLKSIVVDSFRIRAAHNIHNFFSLYLINSTLSLLPTNLASVFILMKRIADTLLTVVTGPLLRVLTNEVGVAMHAGAHKQVRDRLRSLDMRLPVLFIVVLVAGWVFGFAIGEVQRINVAELRYGLICFTLLIIQTTLIATETPYALVSLALHRSRVFYLSNTIFLTALVSSLLLLRDVSLAFSLPAGLAFAQVFNFFIIRHAAKVTLEGELNG